MDDFEGIGYFLLAALLVVVLMFGGVIWMASVSCKAKAVSFDSYSFGPIQGCMVLHNDRWLPLENIRGFDGRD
jgi:hypothetical protein